MLIIYLLWYYPIKNPNVQKYLKASFFCELELNCRTFATSTHLWMAKLRLRQWDLSKSFKKQGNPFN